MTKIMKYILIHASPNVIFCNFNTLIYVFIIESYDIYMTGDVPELMAISRFIDVNLVVPKL